jgi:hypothetical protein
MPLGLKPLIALPLLLGPGAAVSACGEDSSGSAQTPTAEAASASSQRDLIRKTVKRAKREGTDGNATKTCSYITPDGQSRAIQAYSFRYKKELTSCPRMVRFARRAERSYMSDARRATIKRITLRSGGRADVALEGPKIGGYGGIVTLVLRKVGSRWLIDDASFVPYGTGE